MLWLTLFYYPVYFIFYIIKWVVFFLMYPISYMFKDRITEKIRENYKDTDGHPIRMKDIDHPFLFILWLALDDNPYFDVGREYYKGYINKFVAKYGNEFLKSWFWSGIRNNSVNFSRVLALTEYIGIRRILLGKINGRNRLEIKHYDCFPYYMPYFQFYLYKTSIRIKAGWHTNGRFESRIKDESG